MNLEGRTLNDRYRILRHVGSGKMGAVYEAQDSVLDRKIAIKVLTGGNAATRDRFIQEARTMAMLGHPHIVGVHDFGEVDGLSYFVMEYVNGLMLRDAIRAYQPNFAKLVEIFINVLDALDFAHRRSVLHRDVKPGNILISKEYDVRVSDFGLSRRMSDVSSLGTPGEIVGTIAYLPPESFLGKATDSRGDLYSLGVVMYEAFTGSLPFTSAQSDVVAIIYAHVNDVPVPPRALNRALPTALENLILRLLEKNPDARYSHASEVIKDLRAVAQLSVTTLFTERAANTQPPAKAIEPDIRELLDQMLSPQRATKEAFGKIVSGMLAMGRKSYTEAAEYYRLAVDEFRVLKNEVEFVKATIHFAGCITAAYLDGDHPYDRAGTRRAIELVSEAIPLARARNMIREYDALERLSGILHSAELRRR